MFARAKVGALSSLVFVLPSFASTTFGQVVVDGDLRDLEAVAQRVVDDPVNEVCPIGKSGFDFKRVLVFYDAVGDALYLGLDLIDVNDDEASEYYGAIGVLGPGVAGDADGDNNPDFPATNLSCVSPPFLDEDGVGPGEAYCLYFDPTGRNDPNEAFCVTYRGNALTFTHGLAGVPIPGAMGVIALGTVGATHHPTHIPDENPNTADIELRVDHWSHLVARPDHFNMYVLTYGSFGLASDSSCPIEFDANTPPTCADGTVSARDGGHVHVLRINGSAGDSCAGGHEVLAGRRRTLRFSLETSPRGPNPARFVVWGWLGDAANPTETLYRGERLGCTVNPTPLDPGLSPQPFMCFQSPGLPHILCGSLLAPASRARAPWTLTQERGFPTPVTFTIQGVIEDDGADNALGFSVTNAVVLRVQ